MTVYTSVGERSTLETVRIRIAGENDRVFAAPRMILHYIVKHRYLPPEAFIEALRLGRIPDLPPEAFEA